MELRRDGTGRTLQVGQWRMPFVLGRCFCRTTQYSIHLKSSLSCLENLQSLWECGVRLRGSARNWGTRASHLWFHAGIEAGRHHQPNAQSLSVWPDRKNSVFASSQYMVWKPKFGPTDKGEQCSKKGNRYVAEIPCGRHFWGSLNEGWWRVQKLWTKNTWQDVASKELKTPVKYHALKQLGPKFQEGSKVIEWIGSRVATGKRAQYHWTSCRNNLATCWIFWTQLLGPDLGSQTSQCTLKGDLLILLWNSFLSRYIGKKIIKMQLFKLDWDIWRIQFWDLFER